MSPLPGGATSAVMTGIPVTAFQLAQRYVGVVRERPGEKHHPLIQWWLSLCFDGDLDLPDETSWCSVFVSAIAWDLRLPRSKSARARSWLLVGLPIRLDQAQPAFDVVVLRRGTKHGPEVIDAPGHVGFYAAHDKTRVTVLGGNQANAVSLAKFDVNDVLGVRRLLF